ncbi:phage portal protein [Lachnotalea glycerini]|uniref:Phage portal protein n=2 Tax=Lachnotalea glycerini TaxID=1763509 RepID=A0A371JC45_9FIRM|nr:phage portal protein [Lachnotalea glycerini]
MLRDISITNSGYDESGASRTKNSMKGWNANSKSPQEDIDKNVSILRQRSRSLFTSAPIAVSAIKTSRTNIVGTGLRLRATVDADMLGMSHEKATEWNKKTQREFKLWADSKFCDSTLQNNFYELQQLVELSYLMNGDVGAIVQYDTKKKPCIPYGLKIHLVEADKICTPHSYGYVDLNAKASNGNRIYNGVEIDDKGAVQAYYICNAYPNSMTEANKEWKRVRAFNQVTGLPNVLMVYESERPEQYRGVPFLAPVIESIKQLTRYSEAEIMAAVINGFFTVFITTEKNPSEMLFGGVGEESQGDNLSDVGDYGLGPGMINILEPGEDIKMADPSRPTGNFDSFTSAYAKYIGAALELPCELLLKSFTNSYSASKAALEEAWKAFKMKRSWLANDFCQPIYEIFLHEAIGIGRIKAPGFFLDPLVKKAYCKAEWNGPAKGMLDPLKEVNAAEKRIKIGISTREIETIEQTGGDFDTNIQQLKYENKLMNEVIEKDEIKEADSIVE